VLERHDGAYTAVMDYMDFCDDLAADTDPDPGGADGDREPAPVSRRCGASSHPGRRVLGASSSRCDEHGSRSQDVRVRKLYP
jgi:hypothetical protein